LFVVEVSTMALDCSKHLIHDWIVHYTNHYLLLYTESNRDACNVEPMYEICCSIYRINDPSGCTCQFWCCFLFRVGFLSNESENFDYVIGNYIILIMVFVLQVGIDMCMGCTNCLTINIFLFA
jgi:hypothetical protein